ncbi:hypothetical protein CHU98_g5100 [Xylaria longipes]|nr:hypothetical protein CHU98_g5100 [Xylaria longipes]
MARLFPQHTWTGLQCPCSLPLAADIEAVGSTMVPSAAASPLRTYVFTCISPYTSMYYTIYIVYVDYVPTVLTTEVPYINYLMHVYLSRVARLSLYLYMFYLQVQPYLVATEEMVF